MLTPLDFLYLTLGIGAIILVIVLSVAIIQLVLVIRDVRKITDTAGSISEHFHEIIVTPLSLIGKVSETVAPYIENALVDKLKKKK